jgi:hypothetical protein
MIEHNVGVAPAKTYYAEADGSGLFRELVTVLETQYHAAMSYIKNLEQEQVEEEERKWQYVCQKRNFVCERCGTYPPKSERDVYFETGFCGACAHAAEKMKSE